MKKEVRYETYRIERDVYTVKLTHLPYGGISYNPIVRVQVMEWHLPPRNLWERITEWWKYNISDSEWDPLLTDSSLDAYCISKCCAETVRRMRIKRGDEEWVR